MSIQTFIKELKEQVDEKKIDLCTPQFVNSDNDYREDLFHKYQSIKGIADKHHMTLLVNDMNQIIQAIDYYYNGEIDKSFKLILEMVESLEKNTYICSAFNKSGAFTNFVCNQPLPSVDLYKARVAKNKDIEDIYSMYHIPFNMRDIITTQRFSIPGVPCLYLGKTIYTCWMELDKPADSDFYVSRAEVDDNISIFNIAINFNLISGWVEEDKLNINMDTQQFILDYTRVWLLSLASSYVVKQYNRNFKSEYIIPQLLMLCLKKLGIHAISYYSKRFTESQPILNFAPLNVNVAIIMDAKNIYMNKINHNIYSGLMKNIKLSQPVNFSEYKNISFLRSTQEGKSDNISSMENGIYVNKHINVANEWYEYNNTHFARLEKFIATIKCVSDIS